MMSLLKSMRPLSVKTTAKTLFWLCALVAVAFTAKRVWDYYHRDSGELQLQPTATMIDDIKPIGELYCLTAIAEDFETGTMEDRGFFVTTYPKCIQTLRKQVSFVIDLDDIEYQPIEGTDTVRVRLPRPRIVLSGKGGTFLCESEITGYDATRLINAVELKIRRRYATEPNFRRAKNNARNVIDAFVRQAGRTPVFTD